MTLSTDCVYVRINEFITQLSYAAHPDSFCFLFCINYGLVTRNQDSIEKQNKISVNIFQRRI